MTMFRRVCTVFPYPVQVGRIPDELEVGPAGAGVRVTVKMFKFGFQVCRARRTSDSAALDGPCQAGTD